MLKYRKFMMFIIIASLMIFLGVGGFIVWVFDQAKKSNIGDLMFESRLAIPELLEPTLDDQGRKVFDLTFTTGEVEFIEGKLTETWGLNEPYLSPTLRSSRGDEVVINVTNGIEEDTSLHWHGMHLPAAMDGGPHQMIKSGETWSPTWKVDQPAASLWFHPHPHGATAEHVYRGAAGMFLIDDLELEELNLPDTYGVDDIPLIIQDKNFNRDGSLNFSKPLFSNVAFSVMRFWLMALMILTLRLQRV